jgi:2-keto-4-pentenoate hydratase/2-oxohepta-3-ene-1,7-dioic acid hydratase in catechol pathway
MKLVSYDLKGLTRVGAQSGGLIVDLLSASNEFSKNQGLEFRALNQMSDMFSFLERGDSALDEARTLIHEVLTDIARGADVPLRKAGVVLSANQVRLRSPIPRPRKNIVCIGLNYHDHWLETAAKRGEPLPSTPVFFTKSPTAVIGPFDDIVYPSATRELDYEVELAVVLGKRGKDIPKEDSYGYVAGYMILNDISARDVQRRHLQHFRGKSLDTFAPLGPCLTTKDEIEDPHNLDIELKVNGETRQKSNTRNLVFKIPDILETLSQDMTLEPGDIVATGTPAGVALGMSPPRYLNVGDVIEAQINGLGSIRNRVVEKSTRS